MKIKKSSQVALGGMASALCLLLMFMTGLIPFATFALPAMAGIVLVAVVVEMGRSTALLVYVAVSLLSLFMSPDKEAAMMFIGFFGFYPVVKGLLDRIRQRPLRMLCKFAVFNVAIVASYWVIINLFGLTEILEEMGTFGSWSLFVTWLLGNVVFVVFDFALGRITWAYENVLRYRFFRWVR